MAIEIGTLRALLSLDSAAFEKGAKRAQASMTRLERSLARTGERMQKFGRMMSTRVTAPLTAAAGLLVRSSLKTIDAQAKMAQSLGTTTASMQVLARAAETAGISQGELEGSLLRMTRRISLAETGAGAGAKALERLRLSAQDFVNLDAAERVKLIQQRLQELVPAAERAGVASQIFGDRTGLAMSRLDAAQIDAARAELERFGVTVSDLDADKIEEANDAMSSLGLVVQGLGNTLAVALAPALTAASQAIANIAGAFSGLSSGMKTAIGVFTALAAAIGPVTLALGLMVSGLSKAFVAVRALTVALFTMRGALIMTGIGALVVGLGLAADYMLRLTEATGSFGSALDALGAVASGVWDGIATAAESLVPAMNATWQMIRAGFLDLMASLQNEWVMLLLNLSSIARDAGLDNMAGNLAEASHKASMAIGDFANRAADARDAADELRKNAGQLASLGFDKASQALDRLQAILDSAKNKSVDTKTAMADLRDAMAGIGAAGGAAAAGASAAAGTPAESVRDLNSELKDTDRISQRVESSFSQAFSSFVTGTQSATDALRGLLNSLLQVASNEAFRAIVGGGGSSGGSIFASILGGIGDLLGGSFGGARATGGPVSAGRTYLVGERGPELFAPATGGQIIPNGAMGGAPVNVDFQVINNMPGAEVQQRRERGPDGREVLIAEVNRAATEGRLSGVQSRYGLQPQVRRR